MAGKILIVDDDARICELVSLYLRKEGYGTREANGGDEALKAFAAYKPDAVILDIMLPETDGYAVCREIRKTSACPVLMLTAKGEVFDKVLGLELGADDYVVKPFDAKELVARIKALLRRARTVEDDRKDVCFPGLIISPSTYIAWYHGEKLDLPPKEFELLLFLARRPNQVFTRDQLLDKIWGYEFFGDTRTVDVHVKRIREKMKAEGDAFSISTVWGVGYKFEVG
jgi:DNA-binding response OmpR family regulator